MKIKLKVLFGLFFFLPFHQIFSQHVMMTNFELKITNGNDCPLRDESKPAIGERKLRTSSDGNWRMAAQINSTALFNYDIKCSDARTYRNNFFKSYEITNEYLPFAIFRHFNTPMVKATCSVFLGCCCESYASDNWDDWADDYREGATENFNFIYRNGQSFLPNRGYTATHTIGNNTLKFDYAWELPQFGAITISGLGTRCPGQDVTFTVDNSPLNKSWLSYFTLKYYWIVSSTSTSYNYQTITNSNTLTFNVPNTTTTQNLKVECVPVINDNYCGPTVNFSGSDYPQYKVPSSIFTISASPPNVSVTPISPTCNSGTNSNNGGLRFVVNGSAPDYSLSIKKKRKTDGTWFNMAFNNSSTATSINNNLSGFVISNLNMSSGSVFEDGEYQFQVKNYYSDFGNQCMTTGTSNIKPQDPSTITSVFSNPPTCFGGSNATIQVTGAGPSGRTYSTYAPSFSGRAGTYEVRAIDNLGCISSNTLTTIVSQPPLFTATFNPLLYNGYGVSCAGRSDGILEINSNRSFNYNINRLTSRDYQCNFNSEQGGWDICTEYFFEPYLSGSKHSTASQINNLPVNTYQISISDFNNCRSLNYDFSVSEPQGFNLNSFWIGNYSGFNISCNGKSNGFITATVSGGVGIKSLNSHYKYMDLETRCHYDEYTGTECYDYEVERTITTTTISSTNFLRLDGLSALPYSFSVSDANGCSVSIPTATLTSPPAILASSRITPITCYGSDNAVVTFTASGGAGGFKYSLSPGTITGTLPTATVSNFTDRAPGHYKARIQDVNGCEYNNQGGILLTITQPGMLTVSGASFDIPCKDGTLSSVAGIVRGGTPPYSYNWIQGYFSTSSVQSFVPNAKAGTYIANVTDKNNCTDNNSLPFQMTLTASEPASKLSFFSSSVPVDCYGYSSGKVVLQASGGWTGYKYGLTKSTIGTSISNSTTISGLAAGLKKYFVRDDKGCIDSTLVSITEPDSLKIAIYTLTNISCFNSKDGVAILSVTGGNTRYTYKLTPASLTAQNFNSSTISGLGAISYLASVTDENNCPANSVSFTLTQPSALISTGKSTDASCGLPTGTATITTSGGVPPYGYQWFKNSKVTGFSSSSISGIYSGFYTAIALDGNNCKTPTVIAVNDLSGPTVTGTALSGTRCWYDRTGSATATAIAFGTKSITGISWVGTSNVGSYTAGLKGDTVYYVGSTDNEGCFSSDTVYIPGPSKGQSTFSKLDPLCHNSSTGKINILNVGGTPPYSNYLYTSSYGKSTVDSLVSTQSSPSSINFQNLIGYNSTNPLRNYRFWFVDSKGCASEPLFTTLYNPSAFNVNFGSDSTEVCLGTTIQLDAGNPGKTYRWVSNTGTFNSTSRNVSINQPGKYSVIVSDANACTASGTFLFKATNGYPGARFLIAPEVYVGDTILLAEISWPYPDTVAWSWPNGIAQIDSTIGNLSVKATRPGTYSITMRAQQGICKAIQTKTIRAIAKPGREMESIYLGLKEVRIYPNPSEGKFTLTAEFGTIADIQIEILDAVHEKSIFSYSDQGQSLYEKTIDLQNYPSGLYFVRVSAGESVKVVRWVKL